jgi:hypothetical protein
VRCLPFFGEFLVGFWLRAAAPSAAYRNRCR